MKKIAALLLSLAMVFTLAACGGNDTAAEVPASDASGGEASAQSIAYNYCVHTATGYNDEAMALFDSTLSELSGGRFVGTTYTAGTMGTEAELVDAVLMGDMTLSTPADTLVLQAIGIDDWVSLPGLVTSNEEAQKYLLDPEGFMSKLLDEQYAEKGLIRLAGMDNGFRRIATTKPVDTVADLQGLKTRVASVWAMMELYNGAGIQSTVVDSSETMTALEQGTVDAVENSFVNLANQGYIDRCDRVLAVDFIYSSRSIICNADWFNSLSAEDQALVREAAQAAADYANEAFAAEEQALVDDPRWTVYELTDEQRQLFTESSDKLWEAARESYDNELLDQLMAGKD